MRRCLIQAALVSLLIAFALTSAWATESSKKDVIGPWEIEATFKNDKFDHCAITRNVDEIAVTFIRTDDGLSLVLQSPNWKLDRGKSYPVRMKAGAANWTTDVAAESDSVSVPVADAKFKTAVRLANVLLVEGAGSTIRVPLSQSGAALTRLEECVAKNSRATETNPFVAHKGTP